MAAPAAAAAAAAGAGVNAQIQPGGKRKLEDDGDAVAAPAKAAKTSGAVDLKHDNPTLEWLRKEILADDTRPDTVDDLRRQLRSMERPIRDIPTPQVGEFIETLELPLAAQPCVVRELCVFQSSDAVGNTRQHQISIKELALLLRLAVLLGADTSTFRTPVYIMDDDRPDDPGCDHGMLFALLIAGRRLGIDWAFRVEGDEYCEGAVELFALQRLDESCVELVGVSWTDIRRRVAHVVGERGLFYSEGMTYQGPYSRPHPLWELVGDYGGLGVICGEYEFDDASPYRYPVDNAHGDRPDVEFALRVNARRDRYRGVVEMLPRLSEGVAEMFHSTKLNDVWSLVVGFLFEPTLQTAFLGD